MRWILLLVLGVVVCGWGCDSGSGSGSTGGGAPPLTATATAPPADGVFVVGSSYSWDAQPSELDRDPEWDIFCSKSLEYIFENPYGHCITTSTPWPEVLEAPAQVYGYLSFQPVQVSGSTQAQDISSISFWLADQPIESVAVIQATWPYPANWEAELHDPSTDHTYTHYSISYYYDLKAKLAAANPGRHFVLTRSNEMMDFIFHDPNAPIVFDDLFRDSAGHMSAEIGRYLQHNALRQALKQETGIDSTVQGVPLAIRDYLDRVVELYPAW